MGKALKIVFIIVFLIVLSANAYAASDQNYFEEFIKDAPYEIREQDQEQLVEQLDFKYILNLVSKYFTKSFKDSFGIFLSLVTICVLLSVFKNIDNNNISNIILCAAGVVTIGIVFKPIEECIDVAKNNIDSANVFCSSAVPVILALCISCASSFSGAVFSSALSFITNVFQIISNDFFIPLIIIYFSVSLLQNFDFSIDLSLFLQQLKKGVKWGIGIFVSLFSLVMSLQTFLSTSQDSVLRRSVKNAVGAFVPVVGTTLSSSIDSVFVIASNTKAILAVIGAVVVISIFLKAIISTFVYGLVVSLAKTTATLLGEQGYAKVLTTVSDAFYLLCATLSTCALMMIISFLLICINI